MCRNVTEVGIAHGRPLEAPKGSALIWGSRGGSWPSAGRPPPRSRVPPEGAGEGSSLSEKEPSPRHLPSLGVTGLFYRFKTVSVRQLQHLGGMYYEGDV